MSSNLDQRQHLDSDRLDVLLAGHPNIQRSRRLASWPRSQSVWTSTTATVPSDSASSQEWEADSNSNPPGIRKEAPKNPASKHRESCGRESLSCVGPV